jgi:pyruvate-formate lyase-activating enzyme
MNVKETIESAAESYGITGKMNIAKEVESKGVSYGRLTNLMEGKGKVSDLIAVLDAFNYKLKAVLK